VGRENQRVNAVFAVQFRWRGAPIWQRLSPVLVIVTA